ncbi:MAG: efflux RND transporter periplasmic adaptor subunit [Bryobacteraceae bacterium]
MKRSSQIVGAVAASLAIGALAGAWLVQRGIVRLTPASSAMLPSVPMPAAPPASPSAPQEIVVTIPPDALERLRLRFAPVTEEVTTTQVRVPGSVQPNAYREVRVTSLVGGVATQVSAELGQTVKRGQTIAQLFSRELAEAQNEFVGFEAQLEAEHKKLVRAKELVGLGAASREELESVEASHQVHTAHVEEARQTLLLLGLNESQIDQVRAGRKVSSAVAIPAPIDGIVTARNVNPGQVVTTAQELFTLTDLSSVWIEGSLLEDHFGTIRIGSRATITTPAYPARTYRGVVEYIDPRVDPQTRTAKVRVVVENTGLALRLGMYMDLLFIHSGARVPVVPAQAIQMIGSASVVYTPVDGQTGQFRQRTVKVGPDTTNGRQVIEGLRPQERVVTDGSFLLRAEALRQHSQ